MRSAGCCRRRNGAAYCFRRVAGVHTNNYTPDSVLSWNSLLFRDPKMLARLMEEQETVLKDPSTPLTWEHLGEMEFLHDCMRETLRMYPPLVSTIIIIIAIIMHSLGHGGRCE